MPDPERRLYEGPARPDGTAEALLTDDEIGAATTVYVQGLVRLGSLGRVTRVEELAIPQTAASASAASSGDGFHAFDLLGSAPNPFREATTVRFTLAEAAPAEVAVYDVLGQRVRLLASGAAEAGLHEAVWGGRDDAGRRVAAGLYVVRLQSRTIRAARTVVRVE